MTTRTDVLKVRVEVDGDGQARAALVNVAQGADEVSKATAGTSTAVKQVGAALGELDGANKEVQEGFEGNSRAITSFQDLLDDLVSGQIGRAKREIAALANETGLLSALLNPVGLAIAAVAVATGAVAVSFYEAQKEIDEYNNALINTGNFAGFTEQQLNEMAKVMGQVTGTQHEFASVLAEVTGTGKFTGDQIKIIGDAAVRSGADVQTLIQAFEKITDDPAKALEEFNQQQHFLTGATYEQIKALQDQGHEQDAVTLAIQTYADTVVARADQVKQSLGPLATAWNDVKSAAAGAWEAMINDMRPENLDKTFAPIENYFSDIKDVLGWLHNPMGAVYQQAYAAPVAANTDMDARRAAAKKSNEAQANSILMSLVDVTGEYKTAEQKRADEIAKIHGEANDAIAAAIKANDQQLADKIRAAEAQAVAAVQSTASKKDRKTGSGGGPDALDRFAANLQARSLTVDTGAPIDDGPLTHYVQTIAQLTTLYDAALAKGKDLTQANKDFSNSVADASKILDDEYQQIHERNLIALQQYSDATEKQVRDIQTQMTLEVARYSMGDKEYAQLEQRVKLEQEYQDTLASIDEQVKKGAMSSADASTARAEALDRETKSLNALIAGYAQIDSASSSFESGAIQAMQNWADQGADVAAQTSQLFTDAFGQMNDALVNFVTTGKLNFGDLVKSIISDLARMELRVLESQILQEILGSFGGGTVNAGVDSAFNSYSVGNTAGGVNWGVSLGGYATGGISKGPQLAMVSEGAYDTEAHVPLPDGRSIPVTLNGGTGGGDSYTFNNTVNVDNSGASTSQSSGDSQKRAAKQLNDQMQAAATQVLTRAIQPGGLLWKQQQGQLQ